MFPKLIARRLALLALMTACLCWSTVAALLACQLGTEACRCPSASGSNSILMKCGPLRADPTMPSRTFPSLDTLSRSDVYDQIKVNNLHFKLIGNNSLGLNYTIRQWNLQSNQIASIEPGAFNSILGLVQLSLDNNFIVSLGFLMTPEMRQLTLFSATNNLIAALEANLFARSPSLTSIDVSLNSIETVHATCFSGLRMLNSLNLDGNRIRIVESFVTADLASVNRPATFFALSNQAIEEIRPWAFVGLRQMAALNLAANALRTLRNNSFTGMTSLATLDLSANKLSSCEPGAFSGPLPLASLDMSFNQLNTSMRRVFADLAGLRTLLLNDNQLSLVYSDSFSGLGSSLVTLNLANNKIPLVKNDYFSNLSKLELLDLSSNSISAIQAKSFADLTSLKTLYLSANCLFKLDQALFQSQASLTHLYLDSNLLTNVEFAFGSLPNVTNLNLAYNSIFSLSSRTFRGLSKLVALNLSYNYLIHLNESLVSLKSLRSIDLTSNRVQSGTGQFHTDVAEFYFKNTTHELMKVACGRKNASKLDLSFNNLAKEQLIFNLWIKELAASLVLLDLRQTGVHNLSVDYFNALRQLANIDLSDNLIKFNGTFLPYSAGLKALKLSRINLSNVEFERHVDLRLFLSLEAIDLSHNNLDTIKSSYFQSNLNLASFNLSHNRIKTIETGCFLRAQYLLDLTSNQLTSILYIHFTPYMTLSKTVGTATFTVLLANNTIDKSDVGVFSAMPVLNMSGNRFNSTPFKVNVRVFDMSANSLASLESSTFASSPRLEKLYLSCNQISAIESRTFVKMAKLDTLDLSFNRLTMLDNDTFAGLFSLRRLNLRHNALELVQASLLRDLGGLETLNLNGNPIRLIQENAFLNSVYLRTLNVDSFGSAAALDNRTLDNSTFRGLDSIKILEINAALVSNLASLQSVQAHLRAAFVGRSVGVDFYAAANVLYATRTLTNWECFVVLRSACARISVNLMHDASLHRLLDFCGQYSLSELKTVIGEQVLRGLSYADALG